MTNPFESVPLDPRDANEGFLEALIGVPSNEIYMGSPDLARAVIKPVSEGMRIVKKHDPFQGSFGYQVEIFAEDLMLSSSNPRWYPLGIVRSNPEQSEKHWQDDLAEHDSRIPGLQPITVETLTLTCNKCEKKHSINRAFIRFDESIQCPHCGNTAVGEDNIHISPYA